MDTYGVTDLQKNMVDDILAVFIGFINMRNLQESCFLRISYIRPQGEFVVTGTNPHISVFQGFIIQKQERMKVREVIPHIGPIPIVIPLKLFLEVSIFSRIMLPRTFRETC